MQNHAPTAFCSGSETLLFGCERDRGPRAPSTRESQGSYRAPPLRSLARLLSGSQSIKPAAVAPVSFAAATPPLLEAVLLFLVLFAKAAEMASGKACIGKPVPDFSATAVVDGNIKDIKLSDYRGKYVVLFFYPLDFTFVCPTEIIAFSDRVEEFRKINCEVIAASVDSQFTHLAWTNIERKDGGLGSTNIPLVADINHNISKDYGVLKEEDGIAYRGLFIIDDKGILRQITVNDLPVGRSVDETLRLVQAFQFTDEHGEVCPAGWQPGGDTIKPTVKDSKLYFAKQQ